MAKIGTENPQEVPLGEIIAKLSDKKAIVQIMKKLACDREAAKYILSEYRLMEAMARGEIVSPRILPDGTIIMI